MAIPKRQILPGTFSSPHRIRDWQDFEQHRTDIHHNPVRARLCQHPEVYPHSSAHQQQVPHAHDKSPC